MSFTYENLKTAFEEGFAKGAKAAGIIKFNELEKVTESQSSTRSQKMKEAWARRKAKGKKKNGKSSTRD